MLFQPNDKVWKDAFKSFKNDYKNAKKAKINIDKLITEWNDLYYGIATKSDDTRSKIVMKEIAKQIEWQKPNITEPFLSTSHPVRIENTGLTVSGKHMERYLNSHFTSDFDRDSFINQATDVLLREGTLWTRSGWDFQEEQKKEHLTITMNEMLLRDEDPLSLKKNDDGTFDVIYAKSKIKVNAPSGRVCRNEHCFPDPGARDKTELRFFIEKRLLTVSELRKSRKYTEESIKQIIEKLDGKNPGSRNESSLESTRDVDNESYGQDRLYQPEDDPRKKVSILEYWGYYDLDGDGIAEPIVASWAEFEGVELQLEENPLPRQNIPYQNAVYSARPFSLWGNALAYFVGDNQKAKSGIFNGIFDNMSLANNGQKFIKKGSMDYVNYKRMRLGERHILVDKVDGIQDGSFNQLPSSVFNVLQMITSETEQLSGISSGGPALTNGNMNKDDKENQQLTMAQQRMTSLVRVISALLKEMFKDWITMAEVFMTNDQIAELFNEKEQVDFFIMKDSTNAKISLKVGTDVSRIARIQQLNMLLQQSKQLGETVPPETFNKLVSEMFELFNMKEDADALLEYKPQPSQEQIYVQKLELRKLELENAEIEVRIEREKAGIQLDISNAQQSIADAASTIKYKDAQTEEKYAKAEKHKVETALEPAKVITEARGKQQNKSI